MPRLRELGVSTGELPPGRWNAITDVADVRVGHVTLIEGEGRLRPGHGPVRTGVTVILPHSDNLYLEKVPAAVCTLNGFGKPAGFEQVRELGLLEAPIALTNTLNVGLVLDALVQYAVDQTPEIGISLPTVNAVVGETNDGYLNDIQGRHVRNEHVLAALRSAHDGPVEEGAVGAGTGTVCFGWKGGIGSASRIVSLAGENRVFTVGALAQTNFGRRSDLTIHGAAVGKLLEAAPAEPPQSGPGSVMIVLATDAPLSERQLGRVCRRAAVGLARTGGGLSHGSGDFVIAFSTAERAPHRPSGAVALRPALVDEAQVIDLFFRAAAEAVEEAVLNSLFTAKTITGRDSHTAHAIPVDQALAILSISLIK
jgi:D-aminopeptidase